MLLWLVSSMVAFLVIFVDETWYVIYFRTLQGFLVLIISIITVVFSITFYKARKAVRKRCKRSQKDLSRARKEFHVTKVFLLMYCLFLVTFFPLALANPNAKNPLRRIKFLFFALTAVINPMITMTLKKDFKLNAEKSIRKSVVVQSKSNTQSFSLYYLDLSWMFRFSKIKYRNSRNKNENNSFTKNL